MVHDVDISETWLRDKYPVAFNTLLRCHSRFAVFKAANPGMTKKERDAHADEYHIVWATSDYADAGEGYRAGDMIMAENITGEDTVCIQGADVAKGKIIRPRAKKNAAEQTRRVKDKAEVFTPSWICNAQNNLVDEAWFGRKDVFNEEITAPDGTHYWRATPSPIDFPEGKTWQDYVRDNRLEMCCGEGPYITSRYDSVSGEFIPVENRIGLLDRKLRVVSENIDDEKQWRIWALNAVKSVYGFEWQGDSLLLAREAVLYTVLEYYSAKFGKDVKDKTFMNTLAYIIAWNFWQMDGLKMVVPETCFSVEEKKVVPKSLFDEFEEEKVITTIKPCEGCRTGNPALHNGIKCRIRGWKFGPDLRTENSMKKREELYFYQLLNKPE